MILKFEGVVTRGYGCRCSEDGPNGSVFIGSRDVVAEAEHAGFTRPVTVALADERFTGDVAVELGWGYSEWTPMEGDKLTVGEHNILHALYRYEGKIITLWIADEPINLLEREEMKK